MLSDNGIRAEEILLLLPNEGEGTQVQPVSENVEVRDLIRSGLTPADAVLPFTRPGSIEQLSLFK